jgi:hypothetical protein
MEIHPEFDVETKTWFWEDYEARTLPKLCCKVGEGTTVKDYYPNGYQTSKLVTIKPVNVLPPGFADARMRIVTLGKPQQVPVKSPSPPKPRKVMVKGFAKADWSPGDVEILCEGIKHKFSCGQLAKSLGRTRNSVMGRAKRMGLNFHGVRQW